MNEQERVAINQTQTALKSQLVEKRELNERLGTAIIRIERARFATGRVRESEREIDRERIDYD